MMQARPATLARTAKRGVAAVAAALGTLLLAASAAAAGAPLERPVEARAPRLIVEAPDELAAAAEHVRRFERRRLAEVAALLGLERPGPPIRVVLAAEDSAAARNAPSWVSGYAHGALGVVVLFPERAPIYPDASLDELLLHEVAHVLVARAAGGREVPRWFNEGIALHAGRAWRFADRSRTTWALLLDDEVPLAEIDRLFAGGRGPAQRAYALSGALVRDLLSRYGAGSAARLLDGLALGLPFEEAFSRATGSTLARAEASFWRRHALWYRWLPVLTSSATLWLAITLLALVAIRRRRARDAALAALWEEEERERLRRAEAAGDGLVN